MAMDQKSFNQATLVILVALKTLTIQGVLAALLAILTGQVELDVKLPQYLS
jgi:hypothetical protein